MVKIKDISGRDNRQCKNPEVRRSLMLRTRERRLSGVREHDIERERESRQGEDGKKVVKSVDFILSMG
jgi:hypothetical protein